MNDSTAVATIPVAWLKPLPDGYKIPVWRWIVLPATTILLKRNGGVWMNGTLALLANDLSFTQTRLTKSTRTPPVQWVVPLANIAKVSLEKGLASEKIEIQHARGSIKLMSVRSFDFVALLQQALPSR
ncbi:hypothetical protein [Devosia sp. A449]